MTCRVSRVLLLTVLLLGGSHAAAGQNQNQLPNATFDTGVDGWFNPSPVFGAIEWDPGFGQPPGSLRLVGEDDVALAEPCYPIPPGVVQYYWRADVYMDASDEFFLCSINYALYDTPDCSDSFAYFVGDENAFPWVRTPNQWEHLNFDGDGDLRSVGYRSIRPGVGKLADLGSDDACVLDNAYFEMVPLSVTAVPAVSPARLVLLAALMVAAGLVVLRRLSPG